MASASTPGARYIDIGANLTDEQFQGFYNNQEAPYHPPDLHIVLQRAFSAGVDRIIITAGDLAASRAALALARTDPRLFCTVGCHPTRAAELDAHPGGPAAHLDALLAVAREGLAEGKVVAIGECGLDNDRLHFCDAETQRRNFALQFGLQRATGLPMFLHMRAATAAFCALVREHYPEGDLAGVVHSFDGSAEELAQVMALGPGLHVGINGCSLKTEGNVAVAAAVPLDRLMVETDAPWCEVKNTHAGKKFLRPSPWGSRDRKKYEEGALVKGRNEPCRISEVVDVIAGARGVSREEVAEAAYQNTLRVFFPKG